MGDTGQEPTTTTPLSVWDQSTSRFHVRIVACFPLEECMRADAENHLKQALESLSQKRPDLAGKLHLLPDEQCGWVFHTQSPGYSIPFEAINIEADFPCSYSKLKERGFPAAPFVHKRFDYPGTIGDGYDPVPVAGIRAFFINGGLILSVNFHHTFGDGELLSQFLETFAAATRGSIPESSGSRDLDFVNKLKRCNGFRPSEETYEDLLKKCPEYTQLKETSGPNQPTPRPGGRCESEYNRDGRIFVFENDNIRKMKDIVHKHTGSENPVSAYICLATLLWAHSAKARCKLEKSELTWESEETATMSNPVNWRKRAFDKYNKEYFGNAVALAQTKVAKDEVLEACEDEEKWARLVRKVEAGIKQVNEEYVWTRLKVFEKAPDPRMLGLDMDGRIPQNLAFNTWKDYGADTKWNICGKDGEEMKPDVLRRAQVEWNMGGTLIMPARKGATCCEVLLTIPRESMEELCKDGAFLKHVSRVVV